MSYTIGVPQDGQTLGNSKPQIRQNFIDIFNSFAVNHIDFNSMGAGWHNLITMKSNIANPGLLGTANINIFSKVISPQVLPQLYLGQSSTSTIYQLTGTATDATSTPSPNANGYTWLPGGLMLQWFSVLPTNAPQNFPTAFPTNCFAVSGTQQSTSGSVTAVVVSKSQFTAKQTGTSPLCYFWAIGN